MTVTSRSRAPEQSVTRDGVMLQQNRSHALLSQRLPKRGLREIGVDPEASGSGSDLGQYHVQHRCLTRSHRSQAALDRCWQFQRILDALAVGVTAARQRGVVGRRLETHAREGIRPPRRAIRKQTQNRHFAGVITAIIHHKG